VVGRACCPTPDTGVDDAVGPWSAREVGHVDIENGGASSNELICCKLVPLRPGASSELVDIGSFVIRSQVTIALEPDSRGFGFSSRFPSELAAANSNRCQVGLPSCTLRLSEAQQAVIDVDDWIRDPLDDLPVAAKHMVDWAIDQTTCLRFTPLVTLEAQDSLPGGGHRWPGGTHTGKVRPEGFEDSAIISDSRHPLPLPQASPGARLAPMQIDAAFTLEMLGSDS
jgi:hypothetical protein